ncbi:MAG: hypothetical protein AAF678_06895 [Pseudomonadota bacterium]
MSQMSDMSREEAESLLVFLANETLQGDERAAVEAVVQGDADLAAELAALREMRRSLQNETLDRSPGEFGRARLMREIEAETASAVTHVVTSRASVTPFWKIAAVVLLGLFGAQSAFVYLQAEQGAPDLQLASGGEAAQPAGPILRVEFASDATIGTIAGILTDLELVIVDGPSALGFYTLEALDATSYMQAVDVLQSQPELVSILE